MGTVHELDLTTTQRYWLSLLDTSIEAALDVIEADPRAARRVLSNVLEQYREGPQACLVVGYAVECSKGEVYALRRTLAGASKAKRDTESYLAEAGDCGHPAVPRWEAERLPIRVRPVGQEQWRDLLEDRPIIDREP